MFQEVIIWGLFGNTSIIFDKEETFSISADVIRILFIWSKFIISLIVSYI